MKLKTLCYSKNSNITNIKKLFSLMFKTRQDTADIKEFIVVAF